MSPRVFDGWSPAEVHEHFDAAGNKTGHTVVTREPLWDDDDRDRAFALDKFERSACPCGCGLTLADALDPHRAFDVEKGVCYARRAIETIKRREYDKAEKNNRPEGWDDGWFWFISDSYIPPTPDGGARG